ncbi:MAG: putative nucleic acid-binding Zn-ribbon protein [Planctomycetota bacterium]
MHPHVQKLLDLQKVDLEVTSLTKDIDLLPEEEAKRKRRLDQLEQAFIEAAAALKKAEVESRELDTAARDADAQINKLNERLNIVRNNAEYQATLFEIESVRKDRDTTQDDGLKLLETLDGLKVAATTTKESFEGERTIHEGFLQEAEKMRGERAADIAVGRKKREDAADGVPPDLLREYDGLYKTRENLAVAPVSDSYCRGCYNKVTPNDAARVMGSQSIIRCGSCQRILYQGG